MRDSAKKMIGCFSSHNATGKAVGLLLCLLLAFGLSGLDPTDAAPDELLIFHQQHRVRIFLMSIDGRSYVPILDVLHLLDLAYSESGSAGYLRIFAGRDVVELTRNRARVRLNRSSIGLAAPVLFHEGRWLTPRGFVPDVLNRVLKTAIRVSPSGNRWLTGGRDFVRINLSARTTDEASRLVVSLVNAGEIRVRGEERRILFLLGASTVDPPGAEVTSYRDEWVKGISFEETADSSRLVVSLADESVQTRLTRLSGQNAYLVDAFRPTVEDLTTAPEPTRSFRWTRRPGASGWRRIAIDPGHGGADRGVALGEGLYEKDVTLSIARKVRWVLESRLGVETVLTRGQDRTLSLEDRAREANRSRSDLFLSIHLGNGASPIFFRNLRLSGETASGGSSCTGPGRGSRVRAGTLGSSSGGRAPPQFPTGADFAGGNQRAIQRRRPAELSACALEAAGAAGHAGSPAGAWKREAGPVQGNGADRALSKRRGPGRAGGPAAVSSHR